MLNFGTSINCVGEQISIPKFENDNAIITSSAGDALRLPLIGTFAQSLVTD